jgi:hypothetical protein
MEDVSCILYKDIGAMFTLVFLQAFHLSLERYPRVDPPTTLSEMQEMKPTQIFSPENSLIQCSFFTSLLADCSYTGPAGGYAVR